MSSDEAELVINVWEIVRDFIPHDKRPEIASSLLHYFVNYGFDAADLASIVDEDSDLTFAYEDVFQPMERDPDDEYDDE